MNKLLSILILTVLIPVGLSAQKKLINSRTSGYYTHVFKLSDKEAFAIALHSTKAINESFMHTPVDSFLTTGYALHKKQPYGNYLYVRPTANRLEYEVVPFSNLNVRFINNGRDFRCIVTDLNGNPLSGAEVTLGQNKKLKYNSSSNSYPAAYTSKQTVVTVKYQGISSYFTYNITPEREKKPSPYRRSIAKRAEQQKPDKAAAKKIAYLNRYKGYMVFSQPKYKPLDSVKFKAYLVNTKGAALEHKKMRVKLSDGPYGYSHTPRKILLDTITPYQQGGYEYQFLLADSLKLALDRQYSITLEEQVGDEWIAAISGNFGYEDYELKAINFSARLGKSEHRKGEPLTIFLKASDENELAVPDGKVNLQLKTNYIDRYRDDQVFVKDTLWDKTVIMDPIGETKVTVPEDVFPKADLNMTLELKFSNSNNETRGQYLYVKHLEDNRSVSWKVKNDSLYLDYQSGGKPAKQKATIYTLLSQGGRLERTDSAAIDIPAAIKRNPMALSYEVRTAGDYLQNIDLRETDAGITLAAAHQKDSLQIAVGNPNQIPFWYTVFSGNDILFEGYTSRLDTTLKHPASRAAHVLVNYLWAGQLLSREASAAYFAKRLQVALLSPELVYPGQTVRMQVKVSDAENRPVAAADVTTLAFTSKFGTNYDISLPDFNKPFFARKNKPWLPNKGLNDEFGQIKLNWDKWGKALHLDTMEYYRFTQTKDLYKIEEKTTSQLSVVSPFVVKDGAIEPIHILYIDGIPVYFSQAQQLKRYAFSISPGYHYIKMRTAGHLIILEGLEFAPYRKTILSVAADSLNAKLDIKSMPPELTADEAFELNKYMMRIEDNFEGKKATLSALGMEVLLNHPTNAGQGREMLVGPIRENFLFLNSGPTAQSFMKEAGYTYTFKPDLLKQKSFAGKYAFLTDLRMFSGNTSYQDYPLQSGEIDSIWNEYLDLRSRTTNLFNTYYDYSNSRNRCRLYLSMSPELMISKPYVKNVILYNPEEPGYVQIYPGQNQNIQLPKGNYRALYLLKDNSYFIKQDIVVQPYGYNYYLWNTAEIQAADTLSEAIDAKIKSLPHQYAAVQAASTREEIIELINERQFDPKYLKKSVSGSLTDGATNRPLTGVRVRIKGLKRILATTDRKGGYKARVPETGILVFSLEGYDDAEIGIGDNKVDISLMKSTKKTLDEVVIRGYQKRSREQTTGSSFVVTGKEVADVPLNAGAAGLRGAVNIRGLSTLDKSFKGTPLVFLDGLPYSGEISALDQDNIAEINVLKDTDATAIYGSRGANGVILIKSRKIKPIGSTEADMASAQQTLRKNFSDQAIWQPRLITDAAGTASFSVKFPDDITSWNTRTIAMNGKGQSGQSQMTIKSFKSLSANFVSPQFSVEGDQMSVIGKLMNYTNMEETATRKMSYDGKEMLNSEVRYKNAHIDTLSITARSRKNQEADSLEFEYTMVQSNGYFDGEQRKIPLMPIGVKETKGYFDVLSRDTTASYSFDAALGKVTINAEASVFPVLLSEIEKLRNYEYLCNEQLASKLKALLLEKKIKTHLGEPFKGEKNIRELLSKLEKNKHPQGTWGWWQGSGEEMWISLHVVEALLQAGESGYTITLNKDQLYSYLVGKLADGRNVNQLYLIKLLHTLDNKYYLKDWIEAIEKQEREKEELHLKNKKADARVALYEQPLYEKLQLMTLRQKAGMPADIQWLLKQQKSTMFGNHYWGEANRYFWNNSVQNTLLAYQILKANGGYRTELDKIARYFLEQRKDGAWRNTYESSLILETILPELIVEGKKPEPPSMVLNQTETVRTFPFSKVLEPGKLSVAKKGDAPVYFTAYQQFQNSKPEKVSKDFTVRSAFFQNDNEVNTLKGGTTAYLKVEVEARADADYVMIEVPVPAGCSYENKTQSYWGVETHREYFKHKTSIFCTKLKQGKYTFTVQLMPRYSGVYNLNPAKAEMMYFPVFYGREGMKKVTVH